MSWIDPLGLSCRNDYLGRTPGKNSRTGREVIARMRQNGDVLDINGQTIFKASDGNWYPLREADMSHTTDAVTWWNNTGRYLGPKSKPVRNWMLDSNNYYLDHYSLNRSAGAQLGQVYTLHTSSRLCVGYAHSPQSHSYLCSWGLTPLPPLSNSNYFGYTCRQYHLHRHQ
ncbi:hypothetical protein D9P45_23340 [Salmonella enterica subsp. enterica serovar Mesbit]|nr:hypothetical protein [Salmonella enterica subsp. enterica serovar Mesbit]